MTSTSVSGFVRAPRAEVYRALVDAAAIATWRVPDGMTARVHEFEPREGGRFRVSLIYDDPGRQGKSGARTDTYTGHFAALEPGRRVVEVIEFESPDPASRGAMTMTTTLADADDGTEVVIRHDGIPASVAPADNETGTRMALAKLAAFVER
ncbi:MULTISPECIES: SRPBCC domain-containing protein [Amycolatopsis]|uniref:SRPBCC domain-containing protein n=1 Tax=Amycolatopsis TaxID=1813 RepID=UPI000B8AA68A|nr:MULTISPECIES: SRPBCC domain-containing protein [Amycolatopsis]OXM64620.1 polyketide cyclase [Amycolatopsis sp. KNN50.9b]